MRTLQRDDKVTVPTAPGYRRLLIQYRKQQLEATQANITRMERVFDDAAQSIVSQISDLPGLFLTEEEAVRQSYLRTLLQDIDTRLLALRTDYADLLTISMTESAQIAAEREAATGRLLTTPADTRLDAEMSTTRLLSDGTKLSVQFGRVAAQAVERCASRVYSDGWQLSDRLYNLDAALRQTIQDTLTQGLVEQISASTLADRLESALSQAGADNPRYQAMRIARTEINTAHREAHILSTRDANGQLKPYLLAVGWRLSLSHKERDICDVWADDDGDGLGPGNYLPDNVPSAHPHCLCYTISVLVDYPDVSAPNKAPEPEEVPESQVAYYAEKYDDPAATRWLENRK